MILSPQSATSESSADREKLLRADRILKAAETSDWSVAYSELDAVPELADYVRWRHLLDRDADFSFAVYLDFLTSHSDWPQLNTVRRRAESTIDESITTTQRLAYFQRYPPISRDGQLRLIEALVDDERQVEATPVIRKVWLESSFNRAEQRDFLQDHGSILMVDDHNARLDRLLWDGRSHEAKRILDLAGPGQRRVAIARIRLQQLAKGVDQAIARVPTDLTRDPGLLYDRLQWRRRKGRDISAREILLDPPDNLIRPQLWWHERKRQTYNLISERRFGEALALVRLHGQTSGLPYAEAEWLSGWLALRFANEPASALTHFENLHAAVETPISLGRAAYWAGRASNGLGDPEQASTWFRDAVEHPTSFYGQLAASELGTVSKLAPSVQSILDEPIRQPSFVHVVDLLCRLDAREQVSPFLRQMLMEEASSTSALRMASECGRPELYMELAKRGIRLGFFDPKLSYPLPKLETFKAPVTDRVGTDLILAIARQESQFMIDAESAAGALGLMQIMPPTAKELAGRMGLPFAEHRLRYDVSYNVQLASFYLDQLLRRYGNTDYLSAAAYNAGPGSVARWIRRNGDPRGMDEYDRIDWLELIPFSETRNYVQRVLEGRRTYSKLLQAGTGIHIEMKPRVGPHLPYPSTRPETGGEAS